MKDRTTKICITSLMASMVLTSTFIRIPVPIGGMNAMIHLGNVFCVLSGLLLGPLCGGLASGIGSFIFDILSPGYIASAPFTFVFKFTMGFVCGHVNKKKKSIVAAISGSACYIVLQTVKHLFKNAYLLGVPMSANLVITAKGAAISIVNAILAVTIAVPLFKVLKKNLRL